MLFVFSAEDGQQGKQEREVIFGQLLSADSISIEVENNTPADNDVIRISGTLTGSFSSNLRINQINFH